MKLENKSNPALLQTQGWKKKETKVITILTQNIFL
jgi:hypothetical protein